MNYKKIKLAVVGVGDMGLKHIDAIKEFGITKWHRKTFGICKQSKLIKLNIID